MLLNELTAIMRNSGIVGAGGAGFPTYAKLDKRADTIVLNCAECEPLFKLHRQLLANNADKILFALNEVKNAVGAQRVIIGIKPSYKDAIKACEYFLPSYKNFSISLLPEVYPAGDEIILIYQTTGRVVKPGKLPISEGVTVFNVETMLNTYCALKENSGVCEKYLSVVGEVKNPITLKVPIGMKFKDVVALAGGETIKNYVYLSGGVMTGRIADENSVVTKTTNAVMVLPDTHQVILKRLAKTQISIKRAMSSCCQCRSCTDLCSRGLLGYPIEPHAFMRAASKGMDTDIKAVINTMYCSQCGLCEMYACPQGLSPRTLIGVAKSELRKNKIPLHQPEYMGVKKEREYRCVPMKRLITRLGLEKYDKPALYVPKNINPQYVKIMLSQHIGAPSAVCVKEGDNVVKGAVIANAADGLSVSIHSSVSGTVKTVTDKYIIIENKEINKTANSHKEVTANG